MLTNIIEFMVGANPSESNSGIGQATKKALTQNTLLEEEFVFMDGDVTTVVVEGVLSITKQQISKVRVNGCLQRVEYESLPNICFKCGHYGHGSESCMGVQSTLLEKEAINFNRVVENIRFAALGEVEGDEQDTVNDLIDDEKVEGRIEKNNVMGSVGDLRIQGTNS
ncbi:hypothetical protein Golob_007243 [Gossypium lobatum]|uniref:CCHC-type domain-containing protein n=1 Tax=Gossypium lobatum TaxID=34289 RepID=A0A7J8MBU6_9ROSI|nr:hypothetical protein [Gossypium lobatum]